MDGCPALQGKDDLSIDQRQNPQEQFGLSEVNGIDHAVIHSIFLTSNPDEDRVALELQRETPTQGVKGPWGRRRDIARSVHGARIARRGTALRPTHRAASAAPIIRATSPSKRGISTRRKRCAGRTDPAWSPLVRHSAIDGLAKVGTVTSAVRGGPQL